MRYAISLLDTPHITEDGNVTRITNSLKAVALLCYLAVNGEQRREHVADMLYNVTTTARSLHRLRELLGRIRPIFPPLKTTRTTVALEKSADLNIDLWQLQAGLQSIDLPTLENALTLYKRPLLADFTLRGNPPFNDWLLIQRENLHRQVMTAYQHICEQQHEQQRWSAGIAAAQRWLALDDLNEAAARWLMRFQLEADQQAAAQATAATLQQRLQAELGVEPEPASAELIAAAYSSRTAHWNGQSLPTPRALPSNSVVTYHRNVDFVGREAVLLEIGRNLLQDSRPVVLTGMGGIGKTQLAVEFAYRFGRFFDAVYWLNFTDPTSAFDDAALIGGERGMQLFNDEASLSQRDKVARVQRAWQEPTPRLLIFDNCTDEQLLLDWLPVTGGASVLVTSTRAVWSRAVNVNPVSLDVLRRAESVQLLQKLAPRLTMDEANDIAAAVGDLPLALQLAGGYLGRYRGVESADYVTQLRSEIGLQHPSLSGRGTQLSATRHPLSIPHTVNMSYKKLQADDAIDQAARLLLGCIACCKSAEALPIALAMRFLYVEPSPLTPLPRGEGNTAPPLASRHILGAGKGGWGVRVSEQTAVDAFSRLRELGLVHVKGQEQLIMHRLIAQFVHAQFVREQFEHTDALTRVVAAMCAVLEQKMEADSTLAPLPFATAHLQSVTSRALAADLPQAGILASYWANYLNVVAEPARFAPIADQAVAAIYHDAIGDEIRPKSLRRIAYTLRELGRNEQARQLFEDGLTIQMRVEGRRHSGSADGFSDLGIMALQDGEFGEARRLLREAVTILEQLPLDERDQLSLGFALLHIGLSYISTGDFADGKPYVERALSLYQDVLPAPNAHRASANSMMGLIWSGLNEHARALPYFKQAVAQFSTVLGADNFRTAIEQGNVAECLVELGDLQEAQQWAAQSFAVINDRFPDTPQAAFAHYLLGKLAWRQGQHEEAIAYLERSVVLYGDEPRYAREKETAARLFERVSKQ